MATVRELPSIVFLMLIQLSKFGVIINIMGKLRHGKG